MSKAIDKIVFSGIIFVLVFTQLAFGGVHVWAYSIIRVGRIMLIGDKGNLGINGYKNKFRD
jgi:hypothetical protein